MKYTDDTHISRIKSRVSKEMGIRFESLVTFNKLRDKDIVKARHLIIYFLNEYTNMSTTQIASIFDKDHSTVTHSIKTVNNWLETDKSFSLLVESIRKMLLEDFYAIEIDPFFEFSEGIIEPNEFVCL